MQVVLRHGGGYALSGGGLAFRPAGGHGCGRTRVSVFGWAAGPCGTLRPVGVSTRARQHQDEFATCPRFRARRSIAARRWAILARAAGGRRLGGDFTASGGADGRVRDVTASGRFLAGWMSFGWRRAEPWVVSLETRVSCGRVDSADAPHAQTVWSIQGRQGRPQPGSDLGAASFTRSRAEGAERARARSRRLRRHRPDDRGVRCHAGRVSARRRR